MSIFLRLNLKRSFQILTSLNRNQILFKPVPILPNLPHQSLRFLKYVPINTGNKIQVGTKMTQVIEKKRQTSLLKEVERKKNKINTSSAPIISCSSKTLNHYPGQIYKILSDNCLASRSWANRRSNGKYFTINSFGNHPSSKDINQNLKDNNQKFNFNDLGLPAALTEVLLKNFDIETPTNIQMKSYAEIISHESHNLIVGETGGGKTLAYLLPLIQTSIQVKNLIKKSNLTRNNREPLSIIIVPTRELAFQVYNVANRFKSISNLTPNSDDEHFFEELKNLRIVCDLPEHHLKAKEKITNDKIDSFDSTNETPIDILITIPGCLGKRKKFSSVYLKKIVLDEADTLLDDSNNEITLDCLSKLELNLNLPKTDVPNEIRLMEPSTQLLFVSATVPRDIKNILEGLIDCESELKTINSNRSNRLMLHVTQRFLRLSADKRREHLLEMLKKELEHSITKRTFMIFTNRTTTAFYVYKFLGENNIQCSLLTKDAESLIREAVVNRFLNGDIRVLVCTDIASRGWDTVHVNHVVNFEMPDFISDYLHRLGRVGRLNCSKFGGSNAVVTNYVTKAYQADLVQNIERSVRFEAELHNVNANAKRFFDLKYTPKDNKELKIKKRTFDKVSSPASSQNEKDESNGESDSSSSSDESDSSSSSDSSGDEEKSNDNQQKDKITTRKLSVRSRRKPVTKEDI